MRYQRCFGPGAPSGKPPFAMDEGCPRTALRVAAGHPRHLEAHLGRLMAGARVLGHAPDWVEEIAGELQGWVSACETHAWALRLRLLSKQKLLWAEMEPLPVAPSPCRLVLMAHPLSARRLDPLTRHKGLCGPWSTAILASATEQGGQDALLSWPDGSLAETAMAAVGLEVDGLIQLPPCEGRVSSLAEALDLPAWADARSLRIQQGPIPLTSLSKGRLWCMNELRGIWPATLL